MFIKKTSLVVFKKITLTVCTLFKSVRENRGSIKNEQSRDTCNIGHKTRNGDKQKKKKKKCDIDYMSVK